MWIPDNWGGPFLGNETFHSYYGSTGVKVLLFICLGSHTTDRGVPGPPSCRVAHVSFTREVTHFPPSRTDVSPLFQRGTTRESPQDDQEKDIVLLDAGGRLRGLGGGGDFVYTPCRPFERRYFLIICCQSRLASKFSDGTSTVQRTVVCIRVVVSRLSPS